MCKQVPEARSLDKTRDVAVIVGTLRKDPINGKLTNALAELASASPKLSIVEIAHLPIYNQDADENPRHSESGAVQTEQLVKKKNASILLEAVAMAAITVPAYSSSAAGNPSAPVAPASMARIGSVDERFQSFNVEMIEVTGGKF